MHASRFDYHDFSAKLIGMDLQRLVVPGNSVNLRAHPGQTPDDEIAVRLLDPRYRNGRLAYMMRDSSLRMLGYQNYRKYLQSSRWKDIRMGVLARDHHVCFGCHGFATQVHHACYDTDTLRGLNIGRLVSVCASCHEWSEFDWFGRKGSLALANFRLGLPGSIREIEAAIVAGIPESCGCPNCIDRLQHADHFRRRISGYQQAIAA